MAKYSLWGGPNYAHQRLEEMDPADVFTDLDEARAEYKRRKGDPYYPTWGSDGGAILVHDDNGDVVDIVMGNPGEVPLHVNLATLAQWAEYEAKVVEEAATEITDPEIKAAAKRQVEGMNEAAEALDKAAESAAETAAEVFVETGVPSDQNPEPVVAGNPSNLWSPWTVFVSDFGYIVARRTTGLGDWDKQEFVTDESGRIAYFNSKAEAQAIANEKNAVTHGNPSKFYRMGYELGKDRLAEAGGDPDQVREPLSGEFAGESISEILGEDFDDDEEMEAAADDFEAGYWAAVYGNPGVPVVSDVAKATGKALDTTAEAITPEVVQKEIRETVAEDIAPEPTDWLFRPRFRKHG